MLHSMTLRLMHVDQLDTLYLCYGVKCQSGVIWGHWGQILIFTKNALSPLCYIACPCNSYIIISLRPFTYVMGSEVNMGSFGVTGVKSCSMLHRFYMLLIHICICVSFNPSTYQKTPCSLE